MLMISRAQPSPTSPSNGYCPHQKHYARGRKNHRCINSYYVLCIDEVVVGSGREWWGGFPYCEPLAEDSATKLNRDKPAICMYCVLCPVLFYPCSWNLCQIGRQFLSVVDNSKVWGILYGLAECLIFHSQLAEWGEVEWGIKLPISLHYLAQGEGQGGGLRSLPLVRARPIKTR